MSSLIRLWQYVTLAVQLMRFANECVVSISRY